MILTKTIDNKRYTLDQFIYLKLSGDIYVQFLIEILDGEDVVKSYFYGYTISPEMVIAVLTYLQQNFEQPMIDKLLELNA